MSNTDRLRLWLSWGIPLVAIVIIVVGLAQGDTEGDEVHAIASRLKCPVCQSESIADSSSEVARDLRGFIAAELEAGRSSDEITQFFVDRYGESIVLDPSGSGRGLVLWLAPAVVLVIGIAGILGLRRRKSELPDSTRAP